MDYMGATTTPPYSPLSIVQNQEKKGFKGNAIPLRNDNLQSKLSSE